MAYLAIVILAMGLRKLVNWGGVFVTLGLQQAWNAQAVVSYPEGILQILSWTPQ